MLYFAIALVSLALASLVLAIAEFYSATLLKGWLFDLGLVAFRTERKLPRPSPEMLGQSLKLERSQLKFGRHDVLFSARSVPLRLSTAGTAEYPIKGRITWSNERATLTVRHPLGALCFSACFPIAWIGFGVLLCAEQRGTDVSYWLIGLLAFGLLIALFFKGRASAVRIASEVLKRLSAHP